MQQKWPSGAFPCSITVLESYAHATLKSITFHSYLGLGVNIHYLNYIHVCVRNMVCIDFSSTIESFSAWKLAILPERTWLLFVCAKLRDMTWCDSNLDGKQNAPEGVTCSSWTKAIVTPDKGMQRCKCWQKDARLDHWFFSIVPLTECLLTEPPQSLEQFGLHASGCWWMGKSDVVLLISVCRLQKWKSSILS